MTVVALGERGQQITVLWQGNNSDVIYLCKVHVCALRNVLKKSRHRVDCNLSVYMYLLCFITSKNDVKPSNVKEIWSMGRMTS